MTMGKNCARRSALAVAAFAALLLAGCSSGHIGEDWQCPLAKGGSCDSVAAADPAVPKTGAVQAPASGQPLRLLPRDMVTERADTPPVREPGEHASMETRSCEAECGFDPFAWLARLFGGSDDAEAYDAKPAMTASAPEMAAAAAVETTSKVNDTGADDLRTGEVVARIWIAPFVDADGIYREASHVRAVLEPAGWRLR